MAGESNEAPPDYLELAAEGPPERAVVWLHGLGADGQDFAPLFRCPGRVPPGTRVVLPHAPPRPVTINSGARMRAWYDIATPDLTTEPDLPGIRASTQGIHALLEWLEREGLEATRVVLGGFSQGGVMALWAGLGYPRPLAGIAALSAYLPADPPLEPAQSQTPIFLAHGRHDTLIHPALGTEARNRLTDLGTSPPLWREYPIDHGVSEAEATELGAWLREVLA